MKWLKSRIYIRIAVEIKFQLVKEGFKSGANFDEKTNTTRFVGNSEVCNQVKTKLSDMKSIFSEMKVYTGL